MSLESHLAKLQQKHGEIERRLDEMAHHPSADDLEIADLKRRKLHLKDEISKIQATAH